ncbi:hypothetical protein RhiirB3_457004 [Rhizophagus irregularis]|nr:hypothetical protein RhiirB3_457004 [Rhizophagus irregularis]
MNKKLGAEVNTKIANELSARLSEVNSTFTAELRVFDSNKEEGETLDYAFETVRREIRHQEKIGKSTVENFYYGRGDPKYTTVMSIMRWVDSKEFSGSLDNNAE